MAVAVGIGFCAAVTAGARVSGNCLAEGGVGIGQGFGFGGRERPAGDFEFALEVLLDRRGPGAAGLVQRLRFSLAELGAWVLRVGLEDVMRLLRGQGRGRSLRWLAGGGS